MVGILSMLILSVKNRGGGGGGGGGGFLTGKICWAWQKLFVDSPLQASK